MREHTAYPIVVFSHVPWNSERERPQQISTRLAKRHPLLFVEEPLFDVEEDALPHLELKDQHDGLTLVQFHVWPRTSPTALDTLRSFFFVQALEQWEPLRHGDLPLFWYYNPIDLHWTISLWPCCGVVYDCTDDVSMVNDTPCNFKAEERQLMRYAEVVFAENKKLARTKSRVHANVRYLAINGDGANSATWRKTIDTIESQVQTCLDSHREALSS